MKAVEIERPHGYLFDSDGQICIRFGNWKPGTHKVPEYVDTRRSPEYVDSATGHSKKLAEAYR